MSDDFISLSDFNSLFDPVFGFRQEQGDRSWQPFGERKFGNKIFIRRVFAIFPINLSFFARNCNLRAYNFRLSPNFLAKAIRATSATLAGFKIISNLVIFGKWVALM